MLSPMRRRVVLVVSAVAGAGIIAASSGGGTRAGARGLPDRLTAEAFWALSADLSEPNGYFRSDNLVSNEILFQHVMPELGKVAAPGRVYLGVGPEQNFSYIATLQPAMAFIVDVRRGNLQLHLLYKALFALSGDRADFVANLFAKARPAGLSSRSTAQEIFAAYEKVDASEALYVAGLAAVRDHFARTLGIALSSDDLKGIEYVYRQFYSYGPSIHYWSTGGAGRAGRNAPTYADLMVADDGAGQVRSFLGTEERFSFVKALEAKHLVVPVVGNFAGPTALRGIGSYVRERGAAIGAFYLSNVEQYVGRDGLWREFCANVASLPLEPSSTFIRSVRNGSFTPGVGLDSELGNMVSETKSCGVADAADLFSRFGGFVAGRSPAERAPARSRH
jgi:hypothetical protein